MLKKKMLEACKAKQQSLIDNFKSRSKTLLESIGLGNEEQCDNIELSQKAQASDEVNSLNEALGLANEEMDVLQYLKSLQEKKHTQVEPGAVVVTNKNTFFISVSIEQFIVDGETDIGLSTKSPLYLAMKGLTKGHKFHCNGVNYKITDIF